MADEQITSSTANIPYVNLINVGSDQAAPAAGRAILYIKNGVAYVRLDTGAPSAIGAVAALAEGRLAVGDGSGVLSALALGSVGQVVTADASGFATWDDPPEGGGGGGAGHIFVPATDYNAFTGSAPTTTTSSNQPFLNILIPTTPAQNDSVSFKVYLEAGTWTFQLNYAKATSCGIYSVQLDAAEVGTVDGYGGTLTYNYQTNVTGIAVAASGLKTLSLVMATKHASSSNYAYRFSALSLWRTS